MSLIIIITIIIIIIITIGVRISYLVKKRKEKKLYRDQF
jgi:uncharacterized membrane protein